MQLFITDRVLTVSALEFRGITVAPPPNFSDKPVRILTVEDFGPFRRFITSLLNERPALRVICEAENGLDAVERAQELKPDLILMDIGLPGLNGIEAARRIRGLVPNSKIIFLTQESSREVVQEAINLGAFGYVLKSEAESDLLKAVEAVLQGNPFFGSGVNGHRRD